MSDVKIIKDMWNDTISVSEDGTSVFVEIQIGTRTSDVQLSPKKVRKLVRALRAATEGLDA